MKKHKLNIPREKILELIVALIEVVLWVGIGIFITYALVYAINDVF